MSLINMKPKAIPTPLKNGMSLIELITVIFIGSLLLSLVFLVYTNSTKSMLRQDVVLQQLLNLRQGLAASTRDARAIGNGFRLLGLPSQGQLVQIYRKDNDGKATEWFRYPGEANFGVAPLYSVDGGDDGPDSIYMCALAPDFSAPLGELKDDFHPGDDELSITKELVVPSGLDLSEIVKENDYLALVPNSGGPVVLVETKKVHDLTRIEVKDLPSGNFPGGAAAVEAGARVLNMKSVYFHRYKIGALAGSDETFLMMDTLDSTDGIVADGIEDLQIGYNFGDSDPAENVNYDLDFNGLVTVGPVPSESVPVTAVRLAMVSRTSKPDPYGRTFKRIEKLNHTQLLPPDSYPRRSLETKVQLRNYQTAPEELTP
jgi:prepilin-type N-terminal cleavage/methylation domain-containing protein